MATNPLHVSARDPRNGPTPAEALRRGEVIHLNEDEIFRVLEGEFRAQLGGEEHRAGSPEGGRFLRVTARGDFERLVRSLRLPEPSSPPTIEALAAAAARHGIEIIGPPLQ